MKRSANVGSSRRDPEDAGVERDAIRPAHAARVEVLPSVAELAVAVVDDHQGQGIGTRPVNALAERAREESIRSFSEIVLAENQLMLNLLAELGRVGALHQEQGIVELIVVRPDSGIGHVRGLLGALARDDLTPPARHEHGRAG